MSTCRFAQRVAAIKNNATVNEELDPALLIRRLKKEAAELKDELKLLGDDEEELNEDDKKECQKLVQSYLVQQDQNALFVGGSMARFQECFSLLREIYWQTDGGSNKIRNGASAETKTQGTMLETLEGSIEQLRQEVAMRDQEISMLVGSLSKRGNNAKEAAQAGPIFIPAQTPASTGHQAQRPPPERMASGQDSAALLLDRNKAFDAFRKSVRRSETLDEGREVMKHLVAEAKEVGERANAARASVQTIQRRIEKEHLGRVMGSVPHDPATKENAVPLDSPEVAALSREKEEKISTYKNSMERLKVVKAEIDKYKLAAEENKERLQRDFEAWYLSLQAHQADLGPADPIFASNPSTEEQARPASAQNHPVVLEPSPRSNSAKESRNVLRGSPGATSPQPSRAAEALTGHQETDDEIRAYFAAVADLESR